MVVHLEDAGLAHPAVVAAVRLVLVAPLAVPPEAGPLHLLQARGHEGARRDVAGVQRRVLPLRVVLRDFPGVLQDAAHVADEHERREVVEDDGLDHAAPSGVLVHAAGSPPGAQLQQRHAMQRDVDAVERHDGECHEGDGQKLLRLAEALPLRRRRGDRRVAGRVQEVAGTRELHLGGRRQPSGSGPWTAPQGWRRRRGLGAPGSCAALH
mmetsp:Transcript_74615/g.230617  ORF Transcript_74615/g.230617 Transcript_74615/m.230617 type:complete len:210 (+) Transcript_74615:619-1248(+)